MKYLRKLFYFIIFKNKSRFLLKPCIIYNWIGISKEYVVVTIFDYCFNPYIIYSWIGIFKDHIIVIIIDYYFPDKAPLYSFLFFIFIFWSNSLRKTEIFLNFCYFILFKAILSLTSNRITVSLSFFKNVHDFEL